MTTFRITLIILGALVVVAIYFYNRHLLSKSNKTAFGCEGVRPEKQDNRNDPVWNSDVDEHTETDEHEIDLPDINLSMLSDLVREAARESGREGRLAAPKAPPKASTSEKNSTLLSKSERPSLLLNDNLLIIHLLAKDKAGFQGHDLLEALTESKIEFGSMQIFHYYSDESDQVLFSVVNIVKPGHFDLDDMDYFSTPGISFFMELDTLDYPLRAFELLLKSIWNIAEALDARICDMSHCSLTPQTATFLHEEVKAYQLNNPLK